MLENEKLVITLKLPKNITQYNTKICIKPYLIFNKKNYFLFKNIFCWHTSVHITASIAVPFNFASEM